MGTILSQCGRRKTNDGSLFHLPAEHYEITKSRKPFGERTVGVCESSPGASKLRSGRKTVLQGLMSRLRENSGNSRNRNLSGQWKRDACSLNATIHYSFDYAQQVHIPSNPQQPGPIYFKTPRKCGIFGVICEGLPRQVNFIIDEASSTGKGANPTISYVHYYFKKHELGETDAHLNADNCAGQNKNNYFLWYLAWRTMMNLHQTITYSFLFTGHTKFAPDRCFGLLKKAYKVSYVSSLYKFTCLVETSSSTRVNKAQLV